MQLKSEFTKFLESSVEIAATCRCCLCGEEMPRDVARNLIAKGAPAAHIDCINEASRTIQEAG